MALSWTPEEAVKLYERKLLDAQTMWFNAFCESEEEKQQLSKALFDLGYHTAITKDFVVVSSVPFTFDRFEGMNPESIEISNHQAVELPWYLREAKESISYYFEKHPEVPKAVIIQQLFGDVK